MLALLTAPIARWLALIAIVLALAGGLIWVGYDWQGRIEMKRELQAQQELREIEREMRHADDADLGGRLTRRPR